MNKSETIEELKFTKVKLLKILAEHNKDYIIKSLESNAVFELHCGVPKNSKYFYNALISIYKIINNQKFNSVWYINTSEKTKTLLKPLFYSVLNFLRDEHNLDFLNCFKISEFGLFWKQKDNGRNRAIYFENWNQSKHLNVITLPNNQFTINEIVVVDFLEVKDQKYTKQYEQIEEMKLHSLISSVILSTNIEEEDKPKIKFIYSLYDLEHFFIKNFHNKVYKFLTNTDTIEDKYLEDLKNEKTLLRINPKFRNCLGGILIHYTNVDEKTDDKQSMKYKYLENIKCHNIKLYNWELYGMIFEPEKSVTNYYLKNLIMNYKNPIDSKNYKETLASLGDNKIEKISDSYHIGRGNKISWVKTLLLTDNRIVILNMCEDLRISSTEKDNEIKYLLDNITNFNKDLLKNNSNLLSEDFIRESKTFLTINNDVIDDIIYNYKSENNDPFGISIYTIKIKNNKRFVEQNENKEEWLKNALNKNKIIFGSYNINKKFTDYFSKIAIKSTNNKWDEEINSEIYDLIEALKLSLFWLVD